MATLILEVSATAASASRRLIRSLPREQTLRTKVQVEKRREVVLLALAGIGVALSALVGSSIRSFTRDLPSYKARLAEETKGLVDWLREHGIPVTQEEFSQYIDPGAAVQLVADVFNGFGVKCLRSVMIFENVARFEPWNKLQCQRSEMKCANGGRGGSNGEGGGSRMIQYSN